MSVPVAFMFNATVISVHDGDTINVEVDRGMYDYTRVPIRLAGCNARELSAEGGTEARDNLAALLPEGTAIVLHTAKPDKYAPRWDAYIETETIPDLTAYLITGQWVAAWNGSGSAPVPPWPRTV